MGNARDKKDRDTDVNGQRLYNPAHPAVGPDVVRLDDIATGAGLVKASGLADATHGATFSPAVVNVDYQKPLAFEGADIVTGSPADTFVLKDTVANLTALGAVTLGAGAGNVHNGTVIWVRSIRRPFRLDTASTATADGMNVVTANGGTGRWHAQLGLDAYWASRTTWWIDPASLLASDENDGASALTPLKTWGELARRLIGAELFSTIVINIVSTLPSSDVVFFPFKMHYNPSAQQYIVVRGTKTTAFSGTISGYAARNPAGNTGTQITSSWTVASLIGKRVESTSGSLRTAWIEADLGSGTARVSVPFSTDFTRNDGLAGTAGEFANGQAINVYSIPSIGAIGTICTQWVYFVDLALPVFRSDAGSVATFGACTISSVLTTSAATTYVGCRLNNAIWINSFVQLFGGCSLQGITVHPSSSKLVCTSHVTLYRISSLLGGGCQMTFTGDIEHFFPAGVTDDASQYVFLLKTPGDSVNVSGSIYGDAVTNLVQFMSNRCTLRLGTVPTAGTSVDFLNSVSGGGTSNAHRWAAVSDLALGSLADELGNEVICGSSPTLAPFRTIQASIAARVDGITGAPHLIVAEQSNGYYNAYAKADSAANASGALAVVVASQQISGTGYWVTAATRGRLLVQFTSAPAVGATAYLSTTDGQATVTPPAVSGTNQFRPLGIVVAVSGTLGLIDWDPAPAPISAFDTTLTWTSAKFDAWGRAIPQSSAAAITTAYQTIQANGSSLAQQTTVNFSTSFAVTNNAGASRTDIALAAVGPGAGVYGIAGQAVKNITLNAFGQVSALTVGSLYEFIDNAGVALTQRSHLNVLAPLVATDNPTFARTEITLAAAGPGAGTYGGGGNVIASETLDAYGRTVAVTTIALPSQGYTTIKNSAGTAMTARLNLKFTAAFALSDVAPDTVVDRATAGPGAGTYGGAGLAVQSISLNAYGDVTSVATTSLYYQTIQDSTGTPVAQAAALKASSSFTVATASGVTTLGLANVGPGAGVYGGISGFLIYSVTLNAFGQVTGVSTAQAYQFVDNAGVALTQRQHINFIAPLVATDNVALTRSEVTLSTAGPGAGAYGGAGQLVQALSLDAYGRVISLTVAGAASPGYTTVKNSAGTSLTARANLKFSAAFNPTDVTPDTLIDLAAVGPGTGTYGSAGNALQSVSLNAFGQVTSVVTVAIASSLATYWVASSTNSPPNAKNLGALASGIVWSDVSAGVATPRRAVPGADYQAAITIPDTRVLYMAGGVVNGNGAFTYDGVTFHIGATATSLDQFVANAVPAASFSALKLVGAAHTSLGTGEHHDVWFALGRSIGFVAGNIPTMRAVRIDPPTYNFASGSTVTTGATLAITGAPTATGGPSLISNPLALWVQAGAAQFDGAVKVPSLGSSMVKASGGQLVPASSSSDYQTPLSFVSPGLSVAGSFVSNDVFTGYAGGSVTWYGSTLSSGSLAINASSNAAQGQMVLQAGGGGLSYTFAFNQTNAMVAPSGTQRAVWLISNFAPTSGTANFRAVALEYTVNQGGGANGLVEGIAIRPTLAALPLGTGGTQLQHLPIHYAPGGTPKWKLYGHGATWMAQADVLNFVGDQGMSANGRPRFYHSAAGNVAAMATTDPIFPLKFSGYFLFDAGTWGTYTEQSFADAGFSSSNAAASIVTLASNSDTWANHASAVTRHEYLISLYPQTMKTVKVRSLTVNIISVNGSGSSGDAVWSLYKISGTGASATITELTRTSTFGSVALPWSTGTFLAVAGQNISPSATLADGDRLMLTCRNTGAASGSGTAAILFTAVARFDMAED